MKSKLIFLVFILLFACSQPSKTDITENDFNVIWKYYLEKEFKESFYENLPPGERSKLLQDIISKTQIPYPLFVQYMKKNHPEKYKVIFIEN